MIELKNGDAIVIESKTRKRSQYGLEDVPVSWSGKFLRYSGADAIQVEMLGNWFPTDPEIIRCELVFCLDDVNIIKF